MFFQILLTVKMLGIQTQRWKGNIHELDTNRKNGQQVAPWKKSKFKYEEKKRNKDG